LWLENEAGEYRIVQALSMTIDTAAVECATDEFVAGFRGGEAIQDLSVASAHRPPWALSGEVWLAVPLMKIERLTGFVVLSPPRAPAVLNWESFDLLLAIGQQVAAYLEEERATSALSDSRALIEHSRKFSFVIHDIKNVAGQLGLTIANMSRYGERAEFRADMIRGMEGAANKLIRLVDRLRSDASPVDAPRLVSPSETIATVVRELDTSDTPVSAQITNHSARVRIAPSDLHTILTHLVTNAVEASSGKDEVTISLKSEKKKVVIEIADRGSGMSAEFVRNRLFIPLSSTKEHGHGMGAYQARHLVRAAGGELEVISAIGRGTTMRIVLPDADDTVAFLNEETAI
jgi:putative PEP-CTERM system histidine kinase